MARDCAVLMHYLAPLQRSLAPDDVTELVVNRLGELGVERAGGWEWRDAPELTDAWLATLARAAAAFTAQDVTEEAPICSTVLPNGERCQIVLPPAVERLSLTVRKPCSTALDLDAFAHGGLFDAVALASDELSADERELTRLRDAAQHPDLRGDRLGQDHLRQGTRAADPAERAAVDHRGRPRAGGPAP